MTMDPQAEMERQRRLAGWLLAKSHEEDIRVAVVERDAAEAKLAKIRTALNDVAQRSDLTILAIYRILNEDQP